MVFLQYVFSFFKHDNIVSGVAVVTGSVNNICNNVYGLHCTHWGKYLYHITKKILKKKKVMVDISSLYPSSHLAATDTMGVCVFGFL